MEEEDALCRPQIGKAKRKRRRRIYEADYTINFNQDIKLKDTVDHKIAFIWGKATNSFFNITETNINLKYYNGTEWKTVQLPIGGHKTIDDFNTRIKPVVENKDNIKLEADTISLKTKFILENGYRIDFNIDNSFGELLGFEKIIVGNSTSTESTRVVEITLIKNVSVECNLVSRSYLNGKKLTFFIDLLFQLLLDMTLKQILRISFGYLYQ